MLENWNESINSFGGIFLVGLFSFFLFSTFKDRVWHLFVVCLFSLVMDQLGWIPLTLDSVYLCIASVSIVNVFIRYLIFLIFKPNKYDLPMYLAISKKSMMCGKHWMTQILSGTKHWKIIVPYRRKKGRKELFCVFEVKGVILHLKSNFDVVSKRRLLRTCYGFNIVGLTNRRLTKILNRKTRNCQIKKQLSCQQYTHFVTHFLAFPHFSGVTPWFGRIDMYMLVLVFLFISILNTFVGTNFDISLLFAAWLLFDEIRMSSEEKFRLPLEKNGALDIAISLSSYILITLYAVPYLPNGYLFWGQLLMDLSSIFIILPLLCDPFVTKEEKRKYELKTSKNKKLKDTNT